MDKLYAFHGADRKSGVTMIAQSIAEYIAEAAPASRILLLILNGRQNVQYLREDTAPIDNYKSRLESGVGISVSDIDKAEGFDNLFVISGVKKEEEKRFYMPSAVKLLLTNIADDFDIIISDTGSELDNGLAVGGLGEAKKTYMILSQNEATIRRYENQGVIYSKIGMKFDAVIINKYTEKDPYSSDYIKRRLDISDKEVYTVQLAETGRTAEMEYKTIKSLENGRYKRDIEMIAADIIKDSDIEIKNEKRKMRWKDFI